MSIDEAIGVPRGDSVNTSFDVVVIGCGPGGQVAATRAAQLGLSVACVDDWESPTGGGALGGTCTNVGCIPAKALLRSSEHFEDAGHRFAEHGIDISGLALNLSQMLARKDRVVEKNNSGIEYLLRKHHITSLLGTGSFVSRDSGGYQLQIARGGSPTRAITGKRVIVATGSRPRVLDGLAFDEDRVLSNTGALAMREVPDKLCVIGAGVVGLELGTVWRRLGAQVTMLEAMPTFLATLDHQIAKEARRIFERQGLSIFLGVQIRNVLRDDSGVNVTFIDASGVEQRGRYDRLIVSVGRVPNTEGLNSKAVELLTDAQGYIVVDEDCRSNLEGIWAIGDVVRGPMLAHKAEEEGSAVAERMVGQQPHVNFNTVPWVIYTQPEIAWVGATEQALQSQGRETAVGIFPFMANGRARANGDTIGFVKCIADAKSDEVLGIHMIGAGVSELIAESVVGMEFGASSEDIGMICHAHPTLSEAIKEAALAVRKRALNI
jgi:dihydrolipoamide dehydrogenase